MAATHLPWACAVDIICRSSPLTQGKTDLKNSIPNHPDGWFCRGEKHSIRPPVGQALMSAQSSAPSMHDAMLHTQDYNYSNCIVCINLLFENQRNTLKKKSNKSTWEYRQMTKLHFLSQQNQTKPWNLLAVVYTQLLFSGEATKQERKNGTARARKQVRSTMFPLGLRSLTTKS